MKKLIFAVAVVLFTTSVFAQSALKPTIKNNKATFVNDAKTSTTLFSLTATDSEIEHLKTQAGTLPNIKLNVSKQKGGNYNCTLIITDRNEALYVQRIFGFFGFDKFTIDGTEKPLSDLGSTLGNLK